MGLSEDINALPVAPVGGQVGINSNIGTLNRAAKAHEQELLAVDGKVDGKLDKATADNTYAPLFQPSTVYATSDTVLLPAPVSAVGKRTATGTSRETFDATEQALWTVASGGATTVDALTDATTVGKAVAKAANAKAARTAISAVNGADVGYEVNLTDGAAPSDPVAYRDADIRAAFSAKTGRIGPGDWHVQDTIVIPSAFNVTLDGANIISHKTGGAAFVYAGSCPDSSRSPRSITSTIAVGGSSIVVADISGMVVGDWVYIISEDQYENMASGRASCLRRVEAIDAGSNTLTLDLPFYRTMPTNPTVVRVTLAGAARLGGIGTIRSSSPSASKKALLHCVLTIDVSVESGITFSDNGGPGFQTDHSVRTRTQAQYSNLIDDSTAGNFGYGVNVGGASRSVQVLGGSADKVRHGFTTNGASHQVHPQHPAGSAGEPEDYFVSKQFVVTNARNAGIDTHEPGRRGVLEVTSLGNSIGWQVRDTDCTVICCTVSRPSLYGGHAAASAVRPTIVDFTVANPSNTPNAGAALLRARVPVTLINAQSPQAPPSGWSGLVADSDVTFMGGGTIGGSRAVTGVVIIQALNGSGPVVVATDTELRSLLIALGIVKGGKLPIDLSNGDLTGANNLTAAGTFQGRLMRAVATAAGDIVLRADGVSGHTGDLVQARVNGANRFLVSAAGDVEAPVNGKGFVARASDGTRWRLAPPTGGGAATWVPA